MGELIILGSGYAVPEEGHENTHLFIRQGRHGILIDCASNPIVHLKKAGIQYDELTDLVVTHFHPDHVSGIPLLVMGLWLLGRKKPIHIYGLPHAIDRLETMMDLYEWKKWPNFFPMFFHRIPEMENSLVIGDDDIKVIASPVNHLIPTIGLRVEFMPQGKSFAYSCDTEPCQAVVALAEKVDLLIHESAGPSIGHSSPAQAAQAARQAQAKRLMLIHYSQARRGRIITDAQEVFPGPISLAEDFQKLEF